MMTQEAPAVWKCRYRLATGCTAEYGGKQGAYAHEKVTGAHAEHRITLRDCPVCGRRCGDEMKRSTHLTAEHGVYADTEQRSDLDARQVKELFDAQYGSPAAVRPVPPPVQMPVHLVENGLPPIGPVVFEPDGHPGVNGDSPAAFDLGAAQDMFAALLHEVVRLRAIVADLEPDAARYRQIKAVLGQD